MTQSLLVTGPHGLLGATLVRVLGDAGFSVHPIEGDIRDAEKLQAFAASLPSLDVVIHTAAATDVNRCEKEQPWCTSVNVDGTRNVRDVAAQRGARLIFTSTVSVFSGKTGNYREDDKLEPLNHYNLTKYEGEKLVAEYARSLILRLSMIGIHPNGSRGRNLVEWMVDSLRANRDMKLFTDIRINPLSNWTLAETIRDFVLRWPEARVLHVGSRTPLSKAEIGRRVAERFPDYTGKLEFATSDELSAIAFRPKEIWLNVERAEKLGFPMPDMEAEIARVLEGI